MIPLEFPIPVDWSMAQGDLRTELTILLYFTLGLLRLEVDVPYALHRGIASPRSLHPTKLFVWLPAADAGLTAGLYRYQPLAHALSFLGEEPPAGRAPSGLAIFVGTDLGRIEPLYGPLAFRLATLEAGQAGALLERIAGVLGWSSHLRPLVRPGVAAPGGDDRHPPSPALSGCHLFLALERLPGAAPLDAAAAATLRAQVLARNSGAEYRGFATQERPLPLQRIRPALEGALSVPGLDLFLVARRVAELTPGLYHAERTGRLTRIAGLRRLPPGRLVPHSGIREGSIPLQLFITPALALAPVAMSLEAGMTLLNLRAGQAAQAIALACGGELACRPSLTFDATRWREIVGPERLPLLSLLVGWNRFRPLAYNLSL